IEARLSHAERIATLGTLSATIAHEVNNPLHAIIANAEFIAELLAQGEPTSAAERRTMTEAVGDVLVASTTIRDFVGRIRAFARRDEETSVDGDLSGVVDTVTMLLKPRIAARGVCVVRPKGPGPLVPHTPIRLTQALMN